MYDAYAILQTVVAKTRKDIEMGEFDDDDHILCYTLRSYISMVVTLVDDKNY